MTSIGATVTACSHENQPNDAPAAPPNAIVGEAGGAAGHGVHRAELRVHEREEHDRDAADRPRDDGRRARARQRALRTEEPARADDRPARRPQQADETDLASQPHAAGRGRGEDVRCVGRGHGRIVGSVSQMAVRATFVARSFSVATAFGR